MLLIAGCNGHVGKEIVRKCIARKMATRCFDLKPLDLPGEDTSSLEIITGDITKLDDVRKAVTGVDVHRPSQGSSTPDCLQKTGLAQTQQVPSCSFACWLRDRRCLPCEEVV